MNDSHFSAKQRGIIFTPLTWAKWLLQEFSVADKWLAGATVCDPTAGDGVFAHALIEIVQSRGISIDRSMLNRLILIEREEHLLSRFRHEFRNRYGVDFPRRNLHVADIIVDDPSVKADIAVGNPPWVNFADLDDEYKVVLKPYFIEYGLAENSQALLLGSSRIDLAALVVSKVMSSLLQPGGYACFFVPLSLFLNGSAHAGFRRMRAKGVQYAATVIYDFAEQSVFPGVSTRCGVSQFRVGSPPSYPITYRIKDKDAWSDRYAAPLHDETGPLAVVNTKTAWLRLKSLKRTQITNDQAPRQGANTAGANSVYLFNEYPSWLSDELIFPMITKESFKGMKDPQRFVLLPYDRKTGKPLSESSLRRISTAWEYLNEHREQLMNRKGVLIRSWIRRGLWWACLGVGRYAFAPYKVAWESMGRKQFVPMLLEPWNGKSWQGNQALHAFVPSWSLDDALRILEDLRDPVVEEYLLASGMAGSRNWAQPGRMYQVFERMNQSKSEPTLFESV